MSLIVKYPSSIQNFEIIAMGRAKCHQLSKKIRNNVFVYVFTVKQIFQDTTFGECYWSLILMNLILLEVKFKYWYFNKVLREISVHKPGSQLIAFRLFNGLAQFVVNLIERRKLSLVDHREISPELN